MASSFLKNKSQEINQNSRLMTTSQLHSETNISKKSYAAVDVFKFFFAICIVALHTKALDLFPHTLNYMITKVVFRVAVPYFFVASGFFLGKKLIDMPKEEYWHILRAYCLRLLKPLIFFEIVSLIYYGLNYLYMGKGLVYTLMILARSIVFYPYGALWYVQASIVGALFLYPFLKKDKLEFALVIGVILYGFALISNNYSFLITGTPLQKVVDIYLKYCISARNGLFTGFIFVSIGVFCSKIYKKVYQRKIITKFFLLVFFLVYVVEILLIYCFNKNPLDDGALFISHLIFVPALFIVTIQLDLLISSKTAVLLRNLSTGIYFLHRPILYISSYFISVSWVNFLVVLCACVLICLFTYKTRLKGLYSLLK